MSYLSSQIYIGTVKDNNEENKNVYIFHMKNQMLPLI